MITPYCPPNISDYDISLVWKEKFDENIPIRHHKTGKEPKSTASLQC